MLNEICEDLSSQNAIKKKTFYDKGKEISKCLDSMPSVG
jgi:hypothetical protein